MKRYTLAAVCVLLCLSGCLPAIQPENRAIVQAAAVDFEDGNWAVTLQLFDPGAGGDSAASTGGWNTAQADGTTLSQTLAAMEAQSGKKLFWGSCQLLAVGRETALRPVLDFCNSLPQSRSAMMVVMADPAGELLKGDENQQESPAEQAERLLLLAEQEHRLPPCRMMQLLAAMETEGRDGILPLLAVNEEGAPALNGSVVLCREEPALDLSPEETALLGMLQGGTGRFLLMPDIPGTAVAVETLRARLDCRMEDGLPLLQAELNARGRLTEGKGFAAEQPLPEQTAAPQQAAARELTVQTEALLQKLCAAGCDPLRFGERLYRKQPELWLETASQSWPELLKKARWQVDTACRLDKG